jgi:hypothetical protein
MRGIMRHARPVRLMYLVHSASLCAPAVSAVPVAVAPHTSAPRPCFALESRTTAYLESCCRTAKTRQGFKAPSCILHPASCHLPYRCHPDVMLPPAGFGEFHCGSHGPPWMALSLPSLRRGPQSVQSDPNVHNLNGDPAPPSSQLPSFGESHMSLHIGGSMAPGMTLRICSSDTAAPSDRNGQHSSCSCFGEESIGV